MSYQEKNAWVSAVALLVVFVPYFFQIGTRLPAGRLDFEQALEMLVASTVLMILLCIFIHIVLALVLRRSDQRVDERDEAIQRRSARLAHAVLVSSCVLVVLGAAAFPSTLVLSQAVLLSVIVSGFTYYMTQIACYRVGRA